jgi:hypothetical protein
MDQLCHGACCCERIRAAEKLGHRCHADACCDPDIIPALVHALQDDPCWEVRKAAAWSIAYQGVRGKYAVLALYLASTLDPHYLVRDGAASALDILIVCRRSCPDYKELFEAADELIKEVRSRKLYKPGDSPFSLNFEGLCARSGLVAAEPAALSPSAADRVPVPELLPAPKPALK